MPKQLGEQHRRSETIETVTVGGNNSEHQTELS
jgi:hypothetical protein